MEEIDLCWRMQLNGWKVTVVPQSIVYHVGGGTLPAASPFKLFLNFRNNLLMLDNNLAKTFALEEARKYENLILVEQTIPGREFSVGILDGKALPPIEIIPKQGFYKGFNDGITVSVSIDANICISHEI